MPEQQQIGEQARIEAVIRAEVAHSPHLVKLLLDKLESVLNGHSRIEIHKATSHNLLITRQQTRVTERAGSAIVHWEADTFSFLKGILLALPSYLQQTQG